MPKMTPTSVPQGVDTQKRAGAAEGRARPLLGAAGGRPNIAGGQIWGSFFDAHFWYCKDTRNTALLRRILKDGETSYDDTFGGKWPFDTCGDIDTTNAMLEDHLRPQLEPI